MTTSDLAEPPLTFTLVKGGPFKRLLSASGVLDQGNAQIIRPALIFMAVTWLPLAVAAVSSRVLSGQWPPAFLDYALHARLLVAIPAFFLGERTMDLATRRCIERLVAGRYHPGGEEPIRQIVASATRWRDSRVAEFVLLALSIFLGQVLLWKLFGLSRGRDVLEPRSTVSLWLGFVALPAYQFLVGWWLWRWAVWVRLLWKISRLDLRPIATHPDMKGGMGFLSEPAVALTPFVFGISAVQAGVWANQVVFRGADINAFRDDLAVIVVVVCLVALGPLLLFSAHLVRARLRGVRQYSSLALDHSRQFHGRWIEERRRDDLLGTPDISSLADLGTAFEVVVKMRLVPFGGRAVLLLVMAVVIPMIPLVLLKVPALDLIRRVGSLVLGGLPG